MTVSQHLSLLQAAGVAGFMLYVLGYFLIATQRLSGSCAAFYLINLCAAALVLVSLAQSFNLASALIQSFWIVISAVGIVMAMWRPPSPSTAGGSTPKGAP